MKTHRSSLILSLLVILAATLGAGCDYDFVTNAGRSAVTSFINEVLTTAVNETVNPSD